MGICWKGAAWPGLCARLARDASAFLRAFGRPTAARKAGRAGRRRRLHIEPLEVSASDGRRGPGRDGQPAVVPAGVQRRSGAGRRRDLDRRGHDHFRLARRRFRRRPSAGKRLQLDRPVQRRLAGGNRLGGPDRRACWSAGASISRCFAGWGWPGRSWFESSGASLGTVENCLQTQRPPGQLRGGRRAAGGGHAQRSPGRQPLGPQLPSTPRRPGTSRPAARRWSWR